MVALVFVPIYGTLNLFAYLSQITLIPALIQAASDPATSETALLLLSQTLQMLPDSTVGFFNGLAYTILGIPSIIYGRVLIGSMKRSLTISGWLLLANGIACILGVFGTVIGNRFLSMGTVMGGTLFWLALFPLTLAFLRE